jgi:hypothetical protein
MSGAVVVMQQNRLIRRFRDVEATETESARTLTEIGCRNSWVFRRMVARGVFIETADSRFYLDEDAKRRFVKRRRRVMFIFLAVAILLFSIWQMCS